MSKCIKSDKTCIFSDKRYLLRNVAIRESAFYLPGKAIHEALKYDFVDNGDLTEEKLKESILKRKGIASEIENGRKKISNHLPIEKKAEIQKLLSTCLEMKQYGLLKGSDTLLLN